MAKLNDTPTARDRLHTAVYEALRHLETHDLPDDEKTAELAARANTLLSDIDALEPTNSNPLGGEKPITADLRPALELYAKLVKVGEELPTERLIGYLRSCQRQVAVVDDDDFLLVEPDLTRRGLAFAFAATHLHYILCGTETVEEAVR